MRIIAMLLAVAAIVAATAASEVDTSAAGRQQCTQEDDSCHYRVADAGLTGDDCDGDDDDCRGWARTEAAGERVPDWLEQLRSRHPCPADGAAAAAAVHAGAWKDDYCCSRGRGRGSWLAMATGWLKPWVCGGPNCHYHAGADFCVRSPALPLQDGTSAGQQCCYHGDRELLLTDPAAGAGTADRRVDLFGHWSEDVKPFLACCRSRAGSGGPLELASPPCALYFQRRPSNTGRPILVAQVHKD